MKEFKIEVPTGYEIDTEKSTFERILFKEAKPTLPQSWEELNRVDGYFIYPDSAICSVSMRDTTHENENILPTRELAEAMLAMCQLLQLRDRYNGDWKADWTDGESKATIVYFESKIQVRENYWAARSMTFKSHAIAEQFLDAPKIRELLEIAKPLL